MADEVVVTSSWRLVVRNILVMYLGVTLLFGGIALFATLLDDALTLTSLRQSLPAVWQLLLFIYPITASFLLLHIAGCYVEITCSAQAIQFYKPLALFGRNQVQALTGLERVTIASYKTTGFVFHRAAARDQRIEFDFLSKAALASLAAFLQRHAIATTNF